MKKTLRKIQDMIRNLIDYIPPEVRKLLPFAGIVLLAIVLIIVIIIAQSCGRRENEEPETAEFVFEEIAEETIAALSDSEGEYADGYEYEDEAAAYETETERAAEPETEPETEPDYGRLEKNGNAELLSVMQRYFAARAVADLGTINELYGITDESAEEWAEDLEVLQFNARYVSSFDDITTYVMDGPYDDCWLVYTTTDVSFYTASTKAPTIMWCFIEKNGDGEYVILDSHALSSELYEYAEEENHSPEVRSLAADINLRLSEALQADPDLDEVYGILRYGSPLWENTSEAETAVAVIDEDAEAVMPDVEDTGAEMTEYEAASDAAEPEGEVSPENEGIPAEAEGEAALETEAAESETAEDVTGTESAGDEAGEAA